MIFWLSCIACLGGIRFLYRVISNNKKNVRSSLEKVNLLIIGAGDAGVLLMKEINKHKELDYYNIVGFMDDNDNKKGKLINGVKVLGGREDIIKVCSEKKVQEIIISIPSADLQTKTDIINICKNTECKLKTVPGIYEIIDGTVSINQIRDVNIEDLLGREPIKLNNENINKYIKDKVVLVTGGGGSIGSELCRQISKFKPSKLLILDIYENNAYELQREMQHEYPNLDFEVIIASVRDLRRMREIFSKYRPYVVFHAAAHKHVPLMENNPCEAIKNNVFGTFNAASCSHEFGAEKFVLISTDKAVNPTNIMGATKRFCEMIIQSFDTISDTEYVAVRFGNVLGSNGSVIPIFKKQIAHGGPVTVTHPEINRFFMTIPEASQLVIQAGAMAKGGEIFVLDMGKPVKIVDLAKDLIKLSGFTPEVDIKIEFTGLRPGEKLYEELLMDEVALTSTEHKKIFVEAPRDINLSFIQNSIDEFKVALNKGDSKKIFRLMEKKVPTYKRNAADKDNFTDELNENEENNKSDRNTNVIEECAYEG
jgi:FlaA1/EpsC-like NDP-sugar epimerase